MPKNSITIASNSDIHAAVAALRKKETLLLSPGVYRLDKCLVVDKDVVIKSATGNPKDVTLVRAGSTALLVRKGAPTFENLTFVSTSAPSDSPADAQDQIPYESCVAVRGGSPTFIGCRATSADQSGFSVRGRRVSASLQRCDVRNTRHGGIFFDEHATGLIDGCLFVDNGLGCVDVEMTPKKEWVEIRNSRLIRSEHSNVSLHNGGRARVVNCNVVAYNAHIANIRDNSVFEAISTKFRGQRPFNPQDADADFFKLDYPFGVVAENSQINIVDSSFGNFLAAVLLFDKATLRMERCAISAGNKSVLLAQGAAPPELIDCKLFKEPEEFTPPTAEDEDDEFDSIFNDDEDGDDNADDAADVSDDKFTDEEWNKASDFKAQKIEELLGPSAPIVYHAIIPYEIGGQLDGYFYPNSRYGGTFLASQELVDPDFNEPNNATFQSFELAFATRQSLPNRVLEQDDSVAPNPEDDPLDEKIMRGISIMTFIGRYIGSLAGETKINRYETLEFPADFGEEAVAGSCFIFDAIGKPYTPPQITLKTALDYFERDFRTPPEKKKTDLTKDGALGLMLIIEITREEMYHAMEHGGAELIQRLKDARAWPFSDLDRAPVV
jgi:hypothetical protein